jgi:altronate hydrolase
MSFAATSIGTPIVIRLAASDNVVVAREPLAAGAEIGEGDIRCLTSVPRGHKIATAPIATGQPVYKYGQIIGSALADIAPGEHVHVQNLGMSAFERAFDWGADLRIPEPLAVGEQRFFQGYRRSSGLVGTRNYIGIVTSVNCSGSVARFIAEAARRENLLANYPEIDGILPIVHGTGCGMAGHGEGFDTLMRTIKGYAAHPNFGGILILGLGCEVLQVGRLADNAEASNLVRTLTIQGQGGTRRSIESGLAALREMLPEVAKARRESVPASELTLGLQCGGSDGYSGITANPALGVAADLLVRQGGRVLLSETPEIYGAEHLLAQRAVSREVSQKLADRIKWWEEYSHLHGGGLDNNPSPGNKMGGLTTILEKSLGAAAKGGMSPLADVWLYGERRETRGLIFMDSPGFDPCSATGQVASGANIICFTTGRGSVYGCKPVPSVKMSTNTPLYEKMGEDMDLNCGDIADGLSTIEQKGNEIFDLLLETASGRRSRSEEFGFGDVEFVPWQIGATF